MTKSSPRKVRYKQVCYGILKPDNTLWMSESCISEDKICLEDERDSINEDVIGGGSRIVPLYVRAAPPVEGERAPQGNFCTSVTPQPAYAAEPASVTGKPTSSLSAKEAELADALRSVNDLQHRMAIELQNIPQEPRIEYWTRKMEDVIYKALESAIGIPSKGEANTKVREAFAAGLAAQTTKVPVPPAPCKSYDSDKISAWFANVYVPWYEFMVGLESAIGTPSKERE